MWLLYLELKFTDFLRVKNAICNETVRYLDIKNKNKPVKFYRL